MEDIMITSGTSFEGYEISEYGPYRFVQTILSSNFLKEIGSSIADIATDRSSIYQEKLDGAMNEAIKSFKEMAGKTKYNALHLLLLRVHWFLSRKNISPSLRRAYLSEKSYMLITIMTSLFQEL